jgi:hypothetical protein
MTPLELVAVGVLVAAALGAAGLGLAAHLCRLLVTDPRELCALGAMFWEVVWP